VATEFASTGADRLVRDEKRVEDAISKTAKTAQKSEGKTKRWMERHKTALLAIGAATSGVMAAIITSSPDLAAALSEVHLNFSMLAMAIGEDWAPAFEWLAGVTEGLAEAYGGLPEPIQDVLAYGLLLGLGLGILSGIVAGLTWLLTPLATALGVTGFVAEGAGASAAVGAGGLGLLGLAAGVLAGVLAFCAVTAVLWKTGIISSIEDAGTVSGRFLVDTTVRFWNWIDKIGAGLKLLVLYGAKYGAEFHAALSDALSNLPVIGGFFEGAAATDRAALENIDKLIEGQKTAWGKDINEGVPNWVPLDEMPGYHPVSGWLDSLFDRAEGGGRGESGETSRMNEMWASLLPEGYQDQMASLEELQTKLADLQTAAGANTSATSEAFAASMEKMDTATSTAGSSIENTTKIMNVGVTKSFVDLTMKAPKWGSDLMGLFLAGLNSKMPALDAKLSEIRSKIEDALSFDLARNDRMAMRWGSDLVEMFGEGMTAAAPQMVMPTPSPVVVAGASTSASAGNTYITIESGAVQVSGPQAQDFDERKIAQYVRDEVGNALRGRGR
jgi:hypothetical protein